MRMSMFDIFSLLLMKFTKLTNLLYLWWVRRWNASKQPNGQCYAVYWTNEQVQRGKSAEKTWRRYSVFIQHDNNRSSHIASITKHAIKELTWEVLPHSSYYADLPPFRLLSDNLRGVWFDNDVEKTWLEFFNLKNLMISIVVALKISGSLAGDHKQWRGLHCWMIHQDYQ